MLVNEQCFEIAYFAQDKLYKSIIPHQQPLLKDKQPSKLDQWVNARDNLALHFQWFAILNESLLDCKVDKRLKYTELLNLTLRNSP